MRGRGEVNSFPDFGCIRNFSLKTDDLETGFTLFTDVGESSLRQNSFLRAFPRLLKPIPQLFYTIFLLHLNTTTTSFLESHPNSPLILFYRPYIHSSEHRNIHP